WRETNVLVIAKAMPGEDNINMIIPEGCSPENFDYPEPILAW
ncbi:unnamed protein product, partial [Brassica rapa]